MKVYVSGKITGLEPEDYIDRFNEAQEFLEAQGYMVMNPTSAMFTCTAGFSDDDYMHVCYAMIDTCDVIYMLDNWQGSKGAEDWEIVKPVPCKDEVHVKGGIE